MGDSEPTANAADRILRHSLQDIAVSPSASVVLNVSHPTDVRCFEAVPFVVGDEPSVEEMQAYYRRALRHAVPAERLLKQMADSETTSGGWNDSQGAHLNSGSTLLAFCVANTANGPAIQRYLLFNYNCEFNDLTSIESQFARRQIAAVWMTSLMGARTFVNKTNAIEHRGKTLLTRRFVEGVDMVKFLEVEGEEQLRQLLFKCEDNNGLMKMCLLKTATNALDLFNAHNLLIPVDTELNTLAHVVSIDHELELASPMMVRWFRNKNPFFESQFPMTEAEIDLGSNSPALPGSFAWRCAQAHKHGGSRAFAAKQLEAGKASRYQDGHPWANLLLLKHNGDVERTLSERLQPEMISFILEGYSSAMRVLDVLGISDDSRESFKQYMKYARRAAESGKGLSLAEILAPTDLDAPPGDAASG